MLKRETPDFFMNPRILNDMSNPWRVGKCVFEKNVATLYMNN